MLHADREFRAKRAGDAIVDWTEGGTYPSPRAQHFFEPIYRVHSVHSVHYRCNVTLAVHVHPYLEHFVKNLEKTETRLGATERVHLSQRGRCVT